MNKQEKRNLEFFIIIPIAVTILLYAISLTYGFRNFDEDVLIKNFYTNKAFAEYIEKFFLVHVGGATEAHGFSFSSIKNIHVSILGIPTFYLISFLFHAKPFLFHAWSLFLHCLAVYFFTLFCYKLTENKQVALISALIWTLHPTNVEPVIWATNWAQPLGAAFYFYTLYKITCCKGTPWRALTFFITLITLVQILFTEHTITIPIAIFLTIFYQTKNLKTSFKTSLSSFVVITLYWTLRTMLITKSPGTNHELPLQLDRLIFLSPQVFLHQLKLIFFPKYLTIDQIDLLNTGAYHDTPLLLIFILVIFLSFKKLPFLSYGLILYLITLLPFLQIIPLYSLVAERYNYFGSAFIAFGIIWTIEKIILNKKLFFTLSIILCLLLGTRSYIRITDWKNSKTLFLSAANTSKSLFKKGIWIYNLAISEKDINKRNDLINLSTNLLNLFINYNSHLEEALQDSNMGRINPDPTCLLTYELDTKSLLAKAAHRIATSYEILNEKENQFEYLLKAADFSNPNSQIQSLIYKDLGTFYFQKNDFNKALDYYIKSNLISQSPTISYAISICYLKLKDFANYEKYLKESVSVISPYNIAPFKTYGQFLELTKNDLQGAAKYYKIATLLEDNPEPYILLATLYLKQNQIDNALKFVKRGLHSFRENPSLLYLHGTVEINKGKIKEGITDLKKAISKKDCPSEIKKESSDILETLKTRNNW